MWTELTIPVPPGLARLCGYPGEARYVGLCRPPGSDEVEYDDGRSWGTGSRGPYLAYTRHRAVGPALARFGLGRGDEGPWHVLIIDQEERRAFAADARTGREFLRRQRHPPLPEIKAGNVANTLADFLDIEKWEEVPIDPAEVAARIRAEARQVEEMLRFLDGSLADAEGGRGAGGGG